MRGSIYGRGGAYAEGGGRDDVQAGIAPRDVYLVLARRPLARGGGLRERFRDVDRGIGRGLIPETRSIQVPKPCSD